MLNVVLFHINHTYRCTCTKQQLHLQVQSMIGFLYTVPQYDTPSNYLSHFFPLDLTQVGLLSCMILNPTVINEY